MANSFPQQASETQQQRGFPAGQQILERFENWLARLVQLTHLRQLTEEELKDAGVYLGDQRDG